MTASQCANAQFESVSVCDATEHSKSLNIHMWDHTLRATEIKIKFMGPYNSKG